MIEELMWLISVESYHTFQSQIICESMIEIHENSYGPVWSQIWMSFQLSNRAMSKIPWPDKVIIFCVRVAQILRVEL